LGSAPIGRHVYAVGPTPWEIVGIVEDVRQAALDVEAGPQVFIDIRQFPAAARLSSPFIAVRASGDPASLTPSIRRLVNQIDSRATLENVATMEQLVSNSVVRPRMYVAVLGSFAAIALLLAVLGIYGVMSYATARRTREFGIRMAVGANARDVTALVLAQSLPPIGLGLLAGIFGATAVTSWLERVLLGVSFPDPATFVGIAVAFAALGILAAYVPARRAASADPLAVLRLE
jgi:predicted lysophospholipase L1 biosynthesis ABC-type transport system permease subunit